MNGWDFSILYRAGTYLLQGRDPYSIAEYFYPLTFTYLLALLALPGAQVENTMFIVWGIINFVLLISAWRKDFWKWFIYLPVLHQFSSGNVELLLWFSERYMRRGWRGALLGAFITLKPQTAVILLPWHLVDWLRHDRRTLVRWVACTAALWGIPLLWRPDWLTTWLGGRGETDFVHTASVANGVFNLLQLTGRKIGDPLTPPILLLTMVLAVIAMGLAIYGLWQRDPNISKTCMMLASPFGLFYTQLHLMGTAPWWLLVPLNWFVMIIALTHATAWPHFLVPAGALVWHLWQQRRAKQLLRQAATPAASR